jgi:hypothetical protein
MKGRSLGGYLVPLLGTILAMAAPSGATAATVVNGGFESGSLNGWHVYRALGDGNWFAYHDTTAPIGGKRGAAPVQPPPDGAFAAVTDEANPDTLILYQDVALEAGQSHQLSLLAYYDSYKPLANPHPDTLSVESDVLGGQANQQFRIDVMKPTAPLESLEPADILATLFHTKPGGPLRMTPTRFTVDLSPFAGQTVRLRIAAAMNQEVLNAGVDAVKIASTVPGASPPPRGSGGGSGRLSIGAAKANRRNGTVSLTVRVPGAGKLEAAGKGLKPASARAASAGSVTLRLKPTASARTRLRRKHKLRTRVRVRYTPSGGPTETASAPVVVRLG